MDKFIAVLAILSYFGIVIMAVINMIESNAIGKQLEIEREKNRLLSKEVQIQENIIRDCLDDPYSFEKKWKVFCKKRGNK